MADCILLAGLSGQTSSHPGRMRARQVSLEWYGAQLIKEVLHRHIIVESDDLPRRKTSVGKLLLRFLDSDFTTRFFVADIEHHCKW
jgi:hypothetical protein